MSDLEIRQFIELNLSLNERGDISQFTLAERLEELARRIKHDVVQAAQDEWDQQNGKT